ncbi:MAG TPA: ATP-binding cassette domain-containing protein [Microlunatus sp.]|nr:ATP-binding cassette domain-containing protein [Microlunatus sp.]
MTGIRVRGLSKGYGNAPALQNVSFDCPVGQITGLVGPNGSGKTSILRLLSALSPSHLGTATFDGRRYLDLETPGLEVGMLLDASAHHPGRSVEETVRIAGITIGLGRRRIREVLETMGLSAVGRRRFGTLSLGMKQRVGLAIAVLGHPRYLLLDEPVNGLDIEAIRWLREFLISFCRHDGGTVLISSHLLRELESYADRVVILSRGRVVVEESMVALRSMGRCEVVADDATRLQTVLTQRSINWSPSAGGARTAVDADSRMVAELAMEHGVLVTELVPGGVGLLERLYMSVASSEFPATTGWERSEC